MRLKQIPQNKKPKINPRQMAFTKSEVAAKRSYPLSEVRSSSQKCQAAIAQEQRRGATLLPRPGAIAGRSYPPPEARGGG